MKMNWMKVVGLVSAACFCIACEDRSETWEYVFPQDTETTDSSTEPDASDDNVWDGTTDAMAKMAEEYCAPYIGEWLCVCTGGVCTVGQQWLYVITLLQAKGTWEMLAKQKPSGVFFSLTCDPLYPPPKTDWGWSIEIVDENTMIEDLHEPDHPNSWFTAICTRVK